MSNEDKAIKLGHPSYVWRFGQTRRLNLVRRFVPIEHRRILDIGAGLGMYVRQFSRFSDHVFGVDLDVEKVEKARATLPRMLAAPGERLPFPDNSFDMTFLHEVIEHVDDDRVTIREAYRVTRPGGRIVIYAPNRLYFFETHGFYLGKRYVFGLMPFVNWFPDPIRRIFVPHVRAYSTRDIHALFSTLPSRVQVHTYVYPGFDNIAARNRLLAFVLRKVLYLFEHTPLRIFGLSHFVAIEKTAPVSVGSVNGAAMSVPVAVLAGGDKGSSRTAPD